MSEKRAFWWISASEAVLGVAVLVHTLAISNNSFFQYAWVVWACLACFDALYLAMGVIDGRMAWFTMISSCIFCLAPFCCFSDQLADLGGWGLGVALLLTIVECLKLLVMQVCHDGREAAVFSEI